MCNQQVQVKVVPDHLLPALWVAARGSDGRRVLLVRESCPPGDVGRAYAAALRLCPVRMLFERAA